MKSLFHVVETLKSKIKQVPVLPGQYLICTDSGDVYYDTESNLRKKLTDIIDLETDADRTAILAPLDKLYFVKESGHFWRYLGGEWVDLSQLSSGSVTPIRLVLRADSWVDGRQTVRIESLKSEHNGIIGLATDLSDEQIDAARSAELYLDCYSDGELTIAVYAKTPQIDIPSDLILFD